METPLQSEKVREKSYQLCREYLQVNMAVVDQAKEGEALS